MDLQQAGEQKHILIISHDVVGAQMAGPGIRYFHLARVLGREFDVILAAPHEKAPDLPEINFQVVQYQRRDWGSLASWVSGAKVVIFPSDIASDFPQLAQSDACLVVDGYDPLLAEWLPLMQSRSLPEQLLHWQARLDDLNQQYVMGDFFLCASERQRDWWLGLLEANGRINPHTYGQDLSLRRLIDVVPFGLPEASAQHTRAVIKTVWPDIAETDRLILWGGGLWPWLDPLTAIHAVARVWRQRQDVRLVFPGTRHPNPWMANTPTHNQAARQTAEALGLLNKAVFFGDWVPYADWGNVLLESDLALTLHYDTLETRLAFRSRVLEYIWAGLPIIATRGDATSELVEKYKLGCIMDYEDVEGVATAILRLLEKPETAFSKQFAEARQALNWERAAQPLVAFCRHPQRAADKVALNGTMKKSFYLSEIARLQNDVDRLQTLVQSYEGGRFIRLMRWLQRLKARATKVAKV